MDIEQNELLHIRREKLDELRQMNINPYGGKFEITQNAKSIQENFDEEVEQKQKVEIAGRLMTKREHGKASFGNIQDL